MDARAFTIPADRKIRKRWWCETNHRLNETLRPWDVSWEDYIKCVCVCVIRNPVWCTSAEPIFKNVHRRSSALFSSLLKGAGGHERLRTREIPGWTSIPHTPPHARKCLSLRNEQSPASSFSASHHGADRWVGQVELARDVCGWVLLRREKRKRKSKRNRKHTGHRELVRPFGHQHRGMAEGAGRQGDLQRQFRNRFIKLGSDPPFRNPPGYTRGCHFIRLYGDLFLVTDVVEEAVTSRGVEEIRNPLGIKNTRGHGVIVK